MTHHPRTPHATPTSRSHARRRAAVVACVVALFATTLVIVVRTEAGANSVVGQLNVSVSAHFDATAGPAAGDQGGERLGAVAGVAAPTTFHDTIPEAQRVVTPFTFSVTCDGCDTDTKITWDFGDGTTETTTSTTVTHAYTTPGRYETTADVVTVGNTTTNGQGSIDVLVSPYFVDVAPNRDFNGDGDFADYYDNTGTFVDVAAPVALPEGPNVIAERGRADREAIWAAAALDLLGDCGTATGFAGSLIDPATTDDGRALFCPEPDYRYIETPAPGAAALPAAATANAVTGELCTANADACDLPATLFSTVDPTATCDAACVTKLTDFGYLGADGALNYNPANCADNWAATPAGTGWSTGAGTEAGCLTRGEFFTSLVTAVAGDTDGALAGPDLCADGPASTGMRRAGALLGGEVVTRTRAGSTMCDTNAAITKTEAYLAVAAAADLADHDPGTLRDLADTDLGGPGQNGDPAAARIGAVLGVGGPLVGTIACVDNTGLCFNGGDTLTRADAAVLFADLLIGLEEIANDINVTVTADNSPQPVGAPVTVRVTTRLPRHVPDHTPVTVTWPASDSIETLDCNGDGTGDTADRTQTASAGTERVAAFSCTYTRTLPTNGDTLQVDVTADLGDGITLEGTGVLLVVVRNDPPALGDVALAPFAEDTATGPAAAFAAFDPEGGDITHLVAAGPADTKPTPEQFAPTATVPVGNPDLGDTAQVTVTSSADPTGPDGTAAEVWVDPAAHAHGRYELWLRSCDPAGVAGVAANDAYAITNGCVTQHLTGTIDAVNDAGVTDPATVTADAPGTFPIPLTATDPHDDGRGGDAGPHTSSFAQWRIAAGTDLDALAGNLGTLQYHDGTSWVPVGTVGADGLAFADADPALRFVTGTDWDAAAPTISFGIAGFDSGYPGPGRWTPDAAVTVAVPAPTAPTLDTVTPVDDDADPAVPEADRDDDAGADRLEVLWAPVDDTRVTGYHVYRDGTRIGSTTGTVFYDATALRKVTYTYTVTAHSAHGTETAPSNSVEGTLPPLPPQTPQIVDATGGTLAATIDWTDTVETDFYTLRRATGPAGPWEIVADELPASAFTDTGLEPGTRYWYQVRANNTGGASAWGPELPDDVNDATTIPGAVDIATVTAALDPTDGHHTTVTWPASTGATAYELFRYVPDTGSWTRIAGPDPATSFTHTDLADGTVYVYAAAACNTETGESTWRCSTRGATGETITLPGPVAVTVDGGGHGQARTLEITFDDVDRDATDGYATWYERRVADLTVPDIPPVVDVADDDAVADGGPACETTADTDAAPTDCATGIEATGGTGTWTLPVPVGDDGHDYAVEVRACNSSGCRAWEDNTTGHDPSLPPAPTLTAWECLPFGQHNFDVVAPTGTDPHSPAYLRSRLAGYGTALTDADTGMCRATWESGIPAGAPGYYYEFERVHGAAPTAAGQTRITETAAAGTAPRFPADGTLAAPATYSPAPWRGYQAATPVNELRVRTCNDTAGHCGPWTAPPGRYAYPKINAGSFDGAPTVTKTTIDAEYAKATFDKVLATLYTVDLKIRGFGSGYKNITCTATCEDATGTWVVKPIPNPGTTTGDYHLLVEADAAACDSGCDTSIVAPRGGTPQTFDVVVSAGNALYCRPASPGGLPVNETALCDKTGSIAVP